MGDLTNQNLHVWIKRKAKQAKQFEKKIRTYSIRYQDLLENSSNLSCVTSLDKYKTDQ